MAKKGKKGTPPHLDKYFARGVISEDQYKFFWPQYWKAKKISAQAEEKVIEKFFGAEKKKAAPVTKVEYVRFEMRKSIASVKRDITKAEKQTGQKFHLVRRDRFGRFNSRGRNYQAIRNGGKKK